MKSLYFKKMSTWTEMLTIMCNVFIQIQIRRAFIPDNIEYVDLNLHKANTELLRYTFVVGLLGLTF